MSKLLESYYTDCDTCDVGKNSAHIDCYDDGAIVVKCDACGASELRD